MRSRGKGGNERGKQEKEKEGGEGGIREGEEEGQHAGEKHGIERRKAMIKDAGRYDRENYSSFVAIAIKLLLRIQ